ncbi:VanW like protein [Corynebacterium kalinowskii]|uniref:VanW like protein n=1 Tax=Corynebacterium kalinowskii TaxID=2675216 RepID=A0A6B8V9W3_9CORY|nr:VanW family protein [Corynebacterium kalinowskii]QGU01143.1 VanW like protein [Corynebacterium kalinowskii]
MTNSQKAAPSKRRGLKITTAVVGGLLGLSAVLYGADFLLTQDQVPRGTTVAGVSVGGMSPEAASEKLSAELSARVNEPVMVTAGMKQSRLEPAAAGLTVNWEETIRSAGKPSLNPIDRVTSFFTEHEVGIASDVSEAALAPELERVKRDLTVAPVDGAVSVHGGKVNQSAPIDGQNVAIDSLRTELVENWLNPAGVLVEPEVVTPDIDAADMKKIAEGDAAKAISAPIVATGRDGIKGEIPLDRMHEVVAFVPFEGGLKTEINAETAQAILAENLSKTEVKKKNATISYSGGSRTITPSADGVKVDWEKVMADFPQRVTGDQPRTFEAVYIDEKATFTTEMAEKATFNDTIGSFTTSGFSGPSGVNIAKTAALVDGAIVAPGETFSLNNWTGPRGAAQGFVESGIIMNGHADKAIGGGISQFATTLYNAYYFAGMEDVAHTPHSYYISRYPAGREATVYDGAIDLVFKNTSQYPVMISAGVSGDSVTVALKGVKTVDVESISGGRWAPTQPKEMKVPGESCSPSSGAPGFTTADTRVIRNLSGVEVSRETFTTVYDPQPIVKCG